MLNNENLTRLATSVQYRPSSSRRTISSNKRRLIQEKDKEFMTLLHQIIDNFDRMTHQFRPNIHMQCIEILKDMLYSDEIKKYLHDIFKHVGGRNHVVHICEPIA